MEPVIRDRRNTNLSTSSSTSTESTVTGTFSSSLTEKQMWDDLPCSDGSCSLPLKENYSNFRVRSRLISAVQILGAILGIIVLWQIVWAQLLGSRNAGLSATHYSHAADAHAPPDKVSIFKVPDDQGHSRWTVRIPQNSSYSVANKQSQDICKQGETLRENILQQSRLVRAKGWRRYPRYNAVDETFLEVEDAERMGILPPSVREESKDICEKSATFVLDDEDAAMGKTLLLLWLSYGLAKKEGRAFFIDDTRWAYGKYTAFFAPPPSPGCAQPPPHWTTPCPRNANHLLISSATVRWTFGPSFEQEFTQRRKTGIERSRRIYDLMRRGYDDLFHLTGENALYSASRIAKFKEEARQREGLVVGIHVRRGDLHPFEHQFSQDYLPLERYGTGALNILRSQQHQPTLPEAHNKIEMHSLVLASDDPETFNSAELRQSVSPLSVQRAQERIQLATKSTLDSMSPTEPIRDPESVFEKFVDENVGWEGGFHAPLLLNLGKEKNNAREDTVQGLTGLPSEDRDDASAKDADRMRELVGQAYLLDLAVLGASADYMVCAVSSSTCRVLAVMMGWDALKEGRWVNVDDDRIFSWDGHLR